MSQEGPLGDTSPACLTRSLRHVFWHFTCIKTVISTASQCREYMGELHTLTCLALFSNSTDQNDLPGAHAPSLRCCTSRSSIITNPFHLMPSPRVLSAPRNFEMPNALRRWSISGIPTTHPAKNRPCTTSRYHSPHSTAPEVAGCLQLKGLAPMRMPIDSCRGMPIKGRQLPLSLQSAMQS